MNKNDINKNNQNKNDMNKNQPLKKQIKLKLDAQNIEQKIKAKLQQIQKNAHIKGFRPGKVPANHIRNLYEKSIVNEVIERDIYETIDKTIKKNNEKTAGMPEIIILEKQNQVKELIEQKKDLEFEIKYEIIPQIQIQTDEFKNFEIDKISPKIEKKHILDAIKITAKKHKNFKTENTPAKKGDQITIDFVGTINGKKFENGSADNAVIEIGTQRYLEKFEEQLIGLKAEDDKKINLTFPKEYNQKDLAGKNAQFQIKVKKVAKPQKVNIDEKLANDFGLKSLKELETAIEKQLEKQAEFMIANINKKKLLDILDKKYQFQIPEVLLKNEIDIIQKQLKQNQDDNDDSKENYEKIARRRVKLGILIAQIAQNVGIKVSDKEIFDDAAKQAHLYRMKKEQMFEFIKKNPSAKEQFVAPILERKTLNYIFEKTKGEEKQVGVDEIEKSYEKLSLQEM